jgi:hypothetical protein
VNLNPESLASTVKINPFDIQTSEKISAMTPEERQHVLTEIERNAKNLPEPVKSQ